MEKNRDAFLESIIDLYGDLLLKNLELNRKLINYLKNETRSTKSSIDLAINEDAILRQGDYKNPLKSQEFDPEIGRHKAF